MLTTSHMLYLDGVVVCVERTMTIVGLSVKFVVITTVIHHRRELHDYLPTGNEGRQRGLWHLVNNAGDQRTSQCDASNGSIQANAQCSSNLRQEA